MMDMELKLADILNPDQLMEGDIIKVEGEYFTIDAISDADEGYSLTVLNDYDEKLEIIVDDEDQIELYVFVE